MARGLSKNPSSVDYLGFGELLDTAVELGPAAATLGQAYFATTPGGVQNTYGANQAAIAAASAETAKANALAAQTALQQQQMALAAQQSTGPSTTVLFFGGLIIAGLIAMAVAMQGKGAA